MANAALVAYLGGVAPTAHCWFGMCLRSRTHRPSSQHRCRATAHTFMDFRVAGWLIRRMIHKRHAVLALALTFLGAARTSAQSSVQLPRGGPITIDGRVDDAEWSAALRIEHPAGTVVRLMRDEGHLYVGITSERGGFASLCIASGADVHILHASAALGAVTYRKNGDAWSSTDSAFRYGMRNRAVDEAAQRERAAYLAEHGWVASTVSMNDSRSQEFQIALNRFGLPMPIAMGRFILPSGSNGETWPSTAGAADGCFEPQLVRGDVPRGLRFDPSKWLRLDR